MSLYNTTLNQPFLFAAFLYSGILMGILYYLFRGIRNLFGKNRLILIFADVLFLLICGGGLLFMVYSLANFKLRLYYILGILLGFGLYSAAIRPLIKYINCKFHKKKIDKSPRE